MDSDNRLRRHAARIRVNEDDQPTLDLGNRSVTAEPAAELVEAIQTLLIELLGHKLRDKPGEDLCRQIAVRLKGAPRQALRQRILMKMESIWSYGFVLNLADDAAAIAEPARRLCSKSGRAETEVDIWAEEYAAKCGSKNLGLDPATALRLAASLQLVPGAPKRKDLVEVVANQFLTMCCKPREAEKRLWSPEEQATWLTDTILCTWSTWTGIEGMRTVFFNKFNPPSVYRTYEGIPAKS